MQAKIKIGGQRSLASKLRRLSAELENDANRVVADHPERFYVAGALSSISIQLDSLACTLGKDK